MVQLRAKTEKKPMGTRLYPITKNPRKIEKLAGVPAGTWEAYRELEKRFPNEDEFYAALYEPRNENVLRLQSFDLNGWGKIVAYDRMGYSGKTKSFQEAREIAILHGLTTKEVRLSNGFHWS